MDRRERKQTKLRLQNLSQTPFWLSLDLPSGRQLTWAASGGAQLHAVQSLGAQLYAAVQTLADQGPGARHHAAALCKMRARSSLYIFA
jgi:hypothetical protein